MDSNKPVKQVENRKHVSFLWKKGNRASKTAFWQFMIMLPVTAFLYVVVYRFAKLPDTMFLEGLIKAEGFMALITLIVTYYYKKGGQDGA